MPHQDILNRHGFRSGWLIDSEGEPWNEANFWQQSKDSLDHLVTYNTKNSGDISAQYPHSPERHRLYINGTRFNLQYDTTPKFEDGLDTYTLKPAGGDAIEYRTAERFRYAVGYVIEPSGAFEINQQLQGDDKVLVGFGEPDIANDLAGANGWFWEFRGGQATDVVNLTEYRDGTLVDEVTTTIPKAYTVWQRYVDRINWYNAGNRVAQTSYTENGYQFNPIIGRNSVDGGRGPSQANFPYVYAVKADATTTGLELVTGSVGMTILGDIDPVLRVKEAVQTGSHSGGNQWEVLFAINKDPNKRNVFSNLTDIDIAQISVDDDVEVVAVAVDPSKTDASNFVVPIYHSATNSSILETTSVNTFPDKDGVVDTVANDFGGFQVGFTTYFVAGTGTANRRITKGRGNRKRPIYNGDYVLFLAKTNSAMNITINYETEQQW